MKKRKEDQSIHRSILQRSWCLPGLLLVTLWPCMVHLDRVRTWMEEENWYPDIQYIDDYFMHIKSCTFLFLAGWMALLLLLALLHRIKGSCRWKGMESLPVLLAAAWLVLSLLSSLLSPYRRISFAGLPESFETLPVLAAYLVTFLYGRMLLQSENERRRLKKALVLGGVLQGLIGLGQFFYYDFWASGVGKWLLFAGSGRDSSIAHFDTDAFHRVYLSFYNPNYAAVYILIVLPFAIEGALRWLQYLQEEKRIAGHLYGILSTAAAVMLTLSMFGTGSKAGRILLLIMVPVYLLVFSGMAARWKRIVTGSYVVLLAAALIVLLHTGGRNLFTGTLASTVPKQLAGTLQDVTVDNGEVVFEFGEQRIRVQVKQDQGMPALYIYDADTGQPIRMEMHEKTGRLRASDENWHLPKKSLTFEALIRGNGADRQAYVTAWYRNQVPWIFRVSDEGTLIYLNPAGKESIPCKAPQVWKAADDRMLTGRLYIWKRTVPLLRDCLLLGHGQETYPFLFPQNDYVGRANVGASQYLQIITKPHNMYLQILFNSGIPAFLCLMAAIGLFCMQAGQRRKQAGPGREPCTACVLALLCFLMLGLLYDSNVSVTPLMCLLAAMI